MERPLFVRLNRSVGYLEYLRRCIKSEMAEECKGDVNQALDDIVKETGIKREQVIEQILIG